MTSILETASITYMISINILSNMTLNQMICTFLMNIRNLVNKLSNFQSFICSSDFSILCITETWLSKDIFDNEIIPSGYTIYRKDRDSRGGGVLLAVKDNITVVVNYHPHLMLKS